MLAVLTAVLMALPLFSSLADAAPEGLTITVDRSAKDPVRITFNHDTTQTDSRYVSLEGSLEKALPAGLTLTLQSGKLTTSDTTVLDVKTASDVVPSGIYALSLAASADATASLGSYELTVEVTTTDKRTDLGVTGVILAGAPTREYDGNTDIATQGTARLTGTHTGDDVALSSGAAVVLAGKDAGTQALVTTAALTGIDAFKYILRPEVVDASGMPITVVVTPRPLSFTGSMSASRLYDATTTPPTVLDIIVENADFFDGLVGGEGFTLSIAGIALGSFPSLAVGDYILPYTGDLALSDPTGGALASNYTLVQPSPKQMPATITPPVIELELTVEEANQALALNKYFTNEYSVDWGDGSAVTAKQAGIESHPYSEPGTYTVTLTPTTLAAVYSQWTFDANSNTITFVPLAGTTVAKVEVSSLPPLSYFMEDATTAPDHFFTCFNYSGALTALPEGSFDTSGIETVSDSFFRSFNRGGALAFLPEGSFDISKIESAGDNFFLYFNNEGSLETLPAASFNTSSIKTTGTYFFYGFNRTGKLESLPEGSFNTSDIIAVDTNFFGAFNSEGHLETLPAGSFDTSNIATAYPYFFVAFNDEGHLKSLPAGSFNTSNIETVDEGFFYFFNYSGSLTSLPAGSFDTLNIKSAGDNFFFYFNDEGSLETLPAGSFNISKIETAGNDFFSYFNRRGSLISLPVGSFDTSHIEVAGDRFFSYFNCDGALTSLPYGSFNISGIKTAGDDFFSSFNSWGGKLQTLPAGSFNTSNIETAGNSFFSAFNADGGQLETLPEGSFNISGIKTAGDDFFSSFNSWEGKLHTLPIGSFDTSNIETAGDNFFKNFNSTDGHLISLPDYSFDTSNITTAGNSFFYGFNDSGALTSLPASFKWPAIASAVGSDNFFHAFDSATAFSGTTAQAIIEECADPAYATGCFSSNQPGYSSLPANWKG
jgi:hypothetical protein